MLLQEWYIENDKIFGVRTKTRDDSQVFGRDNGIEIHLRRSVQADSRPEERQNIDYYS